MNGWYGSVQCNLVSGICGCGISCRNLQQHMDADQRRNDGSGAQHHPSESDDCGRRRTGLYPGCQNPAEAGEKLRPVPGGREPGDAGGDRTRAVKNVLAPLPLVIRPRAGTWDESDAPLHRGHPTRSKDGHAPVFWNRRGGICRKLDPVCCHVAFRELADRLRASGTCPDPDGLSGVFHPEVADKRAGHAEKTG